MTIVNHMEVNLEVEQEEVKLEEVVERGGFGRGVVVRGGVRRSEEGWGEIERGGVRRGRR